MTKNPQGQEEDFGGESKGLSKLQHLKSRDFSGLAQQGPGETWTSHIELYDSFTEGICNSWRCLI